MRKLILGLCALSGIAFAGNYPVTPAEITKVKVTGGFWLPRTETNRLVTLPVDFKKCEETGRIANFENAGKRQGEFKGTPFDDSDVFKVVEGASYILATNPDAKLDKYLDDLIAQFAAAQEEDGYLYTARTLNDKKHERFLGTGRWSNLHTSHELYNVGHLYEAAVAHYKATGKKNLLDVATKNADLLCKVFGNGKDQLKDIPGHEEIEIGLGKLYLATGEKKYLDLAKFFLDMRGNKEARGKIYGEYCQDHVPVKDQAEAVGHAVRAAYLYSGMADVAALEGSPEYVAAIKRIWENVVSKKLHLSGGIGAIHHGERFGKNWELPNRAYLETCAAIANALWNERMFLMTGEGKYVDVLERVLYNGFLSGISLSGDEFFYPNPLESIGEYKRSKWFGCSCCPVNIVRFIPQLPTFTYAAKENKLYWKLFVQSEGTVELADGKVGVKQATNYPWNGSSELTLAPEKEGVFTLCVRIPGWAVGAPVPGNLYRQVVAGSLDDVKVTVNGESVALKPVDGFQEITREWKKGDTVRIEMNMPVRRIAADENVAADKGRLAVERGPIVYCAEDADNPKGALNLVIPADASFKEANAFIAGQAFPALVAKGLCVKRAVHKIYSEKTCVKLVPYFAWAHRGADRMQVWFPASPDAVPGHAAVLLSASHTCPTDSVNALVDGDDGRVLHHGFFKDERFTFWDKKGSQEWLQFDFPEPDVLQSVSVFWFDDTGKGSCRVPESWRIQYREKLGEPWRNAYVDKLETKKNAYNKATFERPVTAQAIRLDIQLQQGFSGGAREIKLK